MYEREGEAPQRRNAAIRITDYFVISLQYLFSDLLFRFVLVFDSLSARAAFDFTPNVQTVSGPRYPVLSPISIPLISIVYCLSVLFIWTAIYAILGISDYLLTICFCLCFCLVLFVLCLFLLYSPFRYWVLYTGEACYISI
jgi:hypothetical protein